MLIYISIASRLPPHKNLPNIPLLSAFHCVQVIGLYLFTQKKMKKHLIHGFVFKKKYFSTVCIIFFLKYFVLFFYLAVLGLSSSTRGL